MPSDTTEPEIIMTLSITLRGEESEVLREIDEIVAYAKRRGSYDGHLKDDAR